jgi:hypothetical protein
MKPIGVLLRIRSPPICTCLRQAECAGTPNAVRGACDNAHVARKPGAHIWFLSQSTVRTTSRDFHIVMITLSYGQPEVFNSGG